jgi:hypothetical protein
MAGTMVQAISLARLGIRIDADWVEPAMGARTADTMSAIWATAQQAAAVQKTAEFRAGDMG